MGWGSLRERCPVTIGSCSGGLASPPQCALGQLDVFAKCKEHRAQESFGLGQLSQDHRTEDEVFKWVLYIPEVPRGEASSWSPPELQRTSGPKDGGRGTRCGFSEIQACFSALVWLLTWCPEGRQTHYLWLLVRDFSDRVPRAAVRTRWRHKVFPKITERTRRSMIVSMDTARTLDRGPATRPTKPWSARKCPEMGDSAQG